LDLALDDMDAANAGNIRNLEQEAKQILQDQASEFYRLVALLLTESGAAPVSV
jgi:hypothetical protein